MQFVYHDLGHRKVGEIIEVTLSARANVRLMDSSNMSMYRRGRRHTFYGGQMTRSPARLPVPRSAHWHVAIDLGGNSGNIRSGVRVLPGLLPELQQIPLSSIPSLVHGHGGLPAADDVEREYDVFISHASEDKDDVVRPLAQALQAGGLRVWYDEFELRIGDSLRRKIDKGLGASKFGVVVLSRSFFGKGWTNYELDGLVTRSVSGDQVLLPIWHNVSKQEVTRFSSSLADKVARNTASQSTAEIAQEIISLIHAP